MKKTNLLIAILFPCFLSAQTPVFYGMTYSGGTNPNTGTIYTFNPTTNRDSVLWSFGNATDGHNPGGNLIYDKTTRLFYGMTGGGGKYSGFAGTIISFNPSTNRDSVLWNFGNGTDGNTPFAGLVYYITTGLYYGTTEKGGTYDSGTIISFNPTNNTESVLWNFGHGTDGAFPRGNLVYDATTGLFYGTTINGGGANEAGTIFSFNPSTLIEHVVWTFGSGADGQNPSKDLAYYPTNGLYYGMTELGGSHYEGTIFSFNASTNTERVVWNFGSGTDGAFPYYSLIYYATNGLFYGTTYDGGSYSYGTIISFNPNTNRDSVLCSFNDTDGAYPMSDLVYYPPNGLFYGTTNQGGYLGAIFSFNPANNIENMVWAFGHGTDGKYPNQGLYLFDPTLGIQGVTYSSSINIYPNPNDGIFNLTIKNEELGIRNNVEVYNMLGEKVYSNPFTTNNSQFAIDMSSQPNGIYLYRVTSETGELIGDGKLIIQK